MARKGLQTGPELDYLDNNILTVTTLIQAVIFLSNWFRGINRDFKKPHNLFVFNQF